MAKLVGIGKGDRVIFAGAPFTLRVEVIDPDDDTKAVDVTGDVELIVKRKQESVDALGTFDGTIQGTFNVTRALNEKRLLFELDSEDTAELIAELPAAAQHALWFAARLKDDPHTVFNYGPVVINSM